MMNQRILSASESCMAATNLDLIKREMSTSADPMNFLNAGTLTGGILSNADATIIAHNLDNICREREGYYGDSHYEPPKTAFGAAMAKLFAIAFCAGMIVLTVYMTIISI